MTDLAETRSLVAYARWANAQILGAADLLTPEAFTRDLRSSYPSVRDTLVHVLWADWLWLERLKGHSPRDLFEPSEFATAEALRHRWGPVESGFATLVAEPGVDLTRQVTYTNTKGEQATYPVGQILRHVVNHATHHRGQVATLLRQLGQVPPTTDFLVFVDLGAPRANHGMRGV
jgi:uncharacterized damage-inducible protein DinB